MIGQKTMELSGLVTPTHDEKKGEYEEKGALYTLALPGA
jgi:hypothetical protein